MQRIPTGIPGLDGLIEGGFPHPSSILVTGATGTGKSIFGMEYLYNGAAEYDEPGFMVNIAGYPNDLQWYSEKFKWDINKLQKKGKLVFSSYDPVDFEKFDTHNLHTEIIMQINKIIDQIGAKRIVIDSVAPLAQSINDQARFRTLLYYLSKAFKEKGCTTIFISESSKDQLTQYNVEPHVMDGVLELSMTSKDDVMNQTLMVRKMVATKYPIAKYLIDFGENGLQLATSYY